MSTTDVDRDSFMIKDDHEKKDIQLVEHHTADLRDLDSIEDTEIGRYVWLVTLAAAIGGLLFGYDTGVISGVLVVIGTDLGHSLSSNEKELITALTSGGAFCGAVVAGFSADRHGRKIVISFGCIVFTIGAVIQAASYSLVQMCVGRFVIGWGVGLAAMVVPIYIAELAPSKHRGRMITIDSLCITGGQVIAYTVDAIFEHTTNGWRYMIGFGGVPSLILLVLIQYCPETPRQLINHQNPTKAARVLRLIYPSATEAQVADKITLIERAVAEATTITQGHSIWWVLKQLYTVPGNLRALTVACGLMAVQQLCGFNSLMYYSATLFALVGFRNPVAVGLVVAGTNFVFTGVSLKYIDRVGRRRILIWTMWGMALALVITAIAFHWIAVTSNLDVVDSNTTGWSGKLVLVSIIVYVAFYATGLGNVPWQANELLPMEVRALGTMMVTCTCWGCNIIISSTFLSLMKGITPSGAFGLYAGICFFGWVAVIFCYPEVSGMTLEAVREVFKHGFGVKYAERIRKERREAERAVAEGGGA